MTTRRTLLCSVQLVEEAVVGKPTAVLIRRHAPVAAAWRGASEDPAEVRRRMPLSRTSIRLQLQQFHPLSWTFMRAMSCCAGLGSPPPREIVVEYSSSSDDGDDYTDDFIKLANAIEDAYPEYVVSGNPDVLQPRQGAFEITSGDLILFSKLKLQRLPELGEVLKAIDALPPLQCELS
ncbi:hypothetical protein L7F22_036214 [Adiantum nelumboides]|nr:hypothetical protein [Adiantum nelumboides]